MADDFPSIEDESEEETEELTASDVLRKLEEGWLNEKFSPELLEVKSDIVDCMLEQIKQMEDNISRAKKGDFKVSIHKMEIDRIKFILSSYLRIRLEKIEKHAAYAIDQEKKRPDSEVPHLSQEEAVFANDFLQNTLDHFKSLALRHMPPNLQTLESKQSIIAPNLDSYVFLRVNQHTEGVLVDEETLDAREEVLDLEEGDQLIIRYQPVSSLVSSGAVGLI